MDLPILDYASARDHMVDCQVRPDKVVDPRLIRAMRTLPRERFVPAALAGSAYIDEDVRLPGGRVLMEPRVLARLVQAARVRAGRAGAGGGCRVGVRRGGAGGVRAQVTALEEDEGLLAIARAVLPVEAPTVVLRVGRLQDGLAGPWDLIMIEGAVSEIPAAIGATLNHQGGRLVTVLAKSGGMGKGVLAEPINPGSPEVVLRAQPQFDCATPLLPAFVATPEFQF